MDPLRSPTGLTKPRPLFNRTDTLSVSAVTGLGLVTLTFDLLTLKLVRITVRVVGKLPTNFGVSGTFCSGLMGQHLSDSPRDLAILTLDLLTSK